MYLSHKLCTNASDKRTYPATCARSRKVISEGGPTVTTCLSKTCLYLSKTCLKRSLKKKTKMVFRTDYRLMQVKSIAECSGEHSAILSTFIKLNFVIRIAVSSILEWPLKTGFTVHFLT